MPAHTKTTQRRAPRSAVAAPTVAIPAAVTTRKRQPQILKPAPVPAPPPAPAPAATAQTKQASLISLLRREGGATMDEMTRLTGWLPHTVRGTISATLRKRLGLQVVCAAEEGGRRYRITA